MRASIYTAKEPFLEPKSKGKTAEIERGPLGTIKPVSRGKEVVSLQITGTRSRIRGTGDRGGEFKAYNKVFKLELEANDLEKILTAAIESRLISIHFKAKRNK